MTSLFEKHRIFLVGGPGGVGKTTLAASLGVALTKEGYRTLVLTVDPAKRLAQLLGLNIVSTELKIIDVPGTSGKLSAGILQPDRFLDRLIHKIAKTPTQRDRILGNQIYQTMAKELGGTEEYAAMESILEFFDDTRFQKIIIDTPPTQNALDLLTAPKKIFEFMDTSVLKWFVGSTGVLSGFIHRGTKVALSALHKIFGTEFFDSFAKFIADLDGLQSGFQERNARLLEILRGDQCAFLLCTVATKERLTECAEFSRLLTEEKIPLRLLMVNQLEPKPPKLEGDIPTDLKKWHAMCLSESQNQARVVEKLIQLGPPVRLIKREDIPPFSIEQLSSLGQSLIE